MKQIKNIRSLYTPLQPTISKSDNTVTYSEFLPVDELQSFIYCYWELKTNQELEQSFTYRVVTDGCIDVFFELNNPSENFVMGFCKSYTEFPLNNSFHYVGVRFLPTAFSQIFNVDASILSNKFQSLGNVSKFFSGSISTGFTKGMSPQKITNNLNEILFEVTKSQSFNDDNRLYNAIHIILNNFGVVNLETDIDTGISPRQLRRLFNFYIGDTPKSFSKVVRFQNILKAKPSTQSLKKNKLFYDLGYFDQAHFIKDFKKFYGVTPSKAFGRE